MGTSDAFVSCSLCGALFTGQVLPQHSCLSSTYLQAAPTLGVPSPPLSLRDHFAGQALTGVLARNYLPGTTAEKCYEIADAMLKAREQA